MSPTIQTAGVSVLPRQAAQKGSTDSAPALLKVGRVGAYRFETSSSRNTGVSDMQDPAASSLSSQIQPLCCFTDSKLILYTIFGFMSVHDTAALSSSLK